MPIKQLSYVCCKWVCPTVQTIFITLLLLSALTNKLAIICCVHYIDGILYAIFRRFSYKHISEIFHPPNNNKVVSCVLLWQSYLTTSVMNNLSWKVVHGGDDRIEWNMETSQRDNGNNSWCDPPLRSGLREEEGEYLHFHVSQWQISMNMVSLLHIFFWLDTNDKYEEEEEDAINCNQISQIRWRVVLIMNDRNTYPHI